MSSTEKETSAVDEAPAAEIPQLGALEEDDEFEEFDAEDWDDADADLSHLVADGSGKAAPEAFWEENWDDDDIEDDFSKQLREELAKTGTSAAPEATMTS